MQARCRLVAYPDNLHKERRATRPGAPAEARERSERSEAARRHEDALRRWQLARSQGPRLSHVITVAAAADVVGVLAGFWGRRSIAGRRRRGADAWRPAPDDPAACDSQAGQRPR